MNLKKKLVINNFFTKGDVLLILKKNKIKLNIEVPDLLVFQKKIFLNKKNYLLKKILTYFNSRPIIIRSSSTDEDLENNSNAGKYKSVKLLSYNYALLESSILEVIKDLKNKEDQFIIQELIVKPDIAGVIFTRNLNNNSPYVCLNYSSSGDTSAITSGKNDAKITTLNIHRDQISLSKFFYKYLRSIKKIEKLFGTDRLDIEFAIKKKKLFIFQCRRLKPVQHLKDNQVESALINIKKKIAKLSQNKYGISGKRTIFSNMADWNPAEMIGTKPTLLSLSLYSELITDTVWSLQRSNYGYKNVNPHPLLINLVRSPYIDLRVDFNSFLPKGLTHKLEEKIVNHALNKIHNNSSLHDKVEFSVMETCYDLNSEKNIKKYLNKKETKIYLNKLKNLTNNIFTNKNLFLNDIKNIEILNDKIRILRKKKLSHINKIFFLIDECKKYGTLSFAGIARVAFICTKYLKTFLELGYLTEKELNQFYNSFNSVFRDINNELFRIKKGKSKKSFFEKYGHLRPSTYSIESLTYSQNFRNYFDLKNIFFKKKSNFQINKLKKNNLNAIFIKNNIKINVNNFFKLAKDAIYYREYSKLIFSKAIDEVLNNLQKLGKEINISKNDLKYLSIKDIINYHSTLDVVKLKSILTQKIKFEKTQDKISKLIDLPDLITSIKDIYFYKNPRVAANYITNKTTRGKIVELKLSSKDFKNINGKIILIENADPGYDFIFSYKINGLITKYGGSNSHMSIRCMELGIPGIIGIGEKNYNLIKNSSNIEINSLQKNYKILN